MNDGDLISRKALLGEFEWLLSVVDQYRQDDVQDSIQRIKNAPAVDAVELPCRIGDTVWTIRHFHCCLIPQEGTVSEMYFTRDMKLQIVVKYVGRGFWGKTVFATREEAEAALRKEKENEADRRRQA